jgi:hypothetical protein
MWKKFGAFTLGAFIFVLGAIGIFFCIMYYFYHDSGCPQDWLIICSIMKLLTGNATTPMPTLIWGLVFFLVFMPIGGWFVKYSIHGK